MIHKHILRIMSALVLICSITIQGAATGETYGQQVVFENNTNVSIELSFSSSQANPIRNIRLGSTEKQDLSYYSKSALAGVKVTVPEGAVLRLGGGAYGIQSFNLDEIITNALEQSDISSGILLKLERVYNWLGAPTLTFKITASPLTTASSPATSMLAAADEDDFVDLTNSAETSPESLQAFAESDFVFYNGSHFSVAVTYEQDNRTKRIIVSSGKKALLGKNIAAGIRIATVSIGGGSKPLPGFAFIAQRYGATDVNLINLILSSYTHIEQGIYQINLPWKDWAVTLEKLDALPTDVQPADTYERAPTEEPTATQGLSEHDIRIELQTAEIGRQFYHALIAQDQTQIAALKSAISTLYAGNPEEGLLKALILYFYYIARKLGHIFEEGTFVVYDPTSSVYAFIESMPGTYKRNASHFNALASTKLAHPKLWLSMRGNTHQGRDIILPAMNKKTILFNTLDEDKKSFYLKPETHGTQALSDFIGHAGSFLVAQGRKQLPSVFGSDDQPSYSKERIPKAELRAFLTIIESLPIDEARKAEMAQNAITYGIQSMYRDARQLQTEQPDNAALMAFIASLDTKSQAGNPKYSHLNLRYGNEVILTPEEFERFNEPIAVTDSFDATPDKIDK